MAFLGCPWPARRWFRLLWCLVAVAFIALLPVLIIELKNEHIPVHRQAWLIAGLFVLLAVPVTVYEVAMHLEYFSRPRLQIYVIRILWMVPIYAVDAWLALRFKGTRVYLDTLRECYEAYVIYNFFMYLLAYLHEEYGDVAAYFSTKDPVPHQVGLQWFVDPWPMGADFFWKCKQGVLSYVILRPLMTAINVFATLCGVYGDSSFRFDRVYIYTAAITNISQCWALYCLVLMYTACHDELQPIRPLSKFLVVKSVVFFSWWQSVGINILVATGVITATEFAKYDVDDISAGLQDFLICVEMFIAALAHAYSFPPRDYLDPTHPKIGFIKSIKVMFDVRDVVDDVQYAVDDTVQRTSDNVAAAGRHAWRATQRSTKRALKGPSNLAHMLRGNSRSGESHDGGEYSDEEMGQSDFTRALLEVREETPGDSHHHDPDLLLPERIRGQKKG